MAPGTAPRTSPARCRTRCDEPTVLVSFARRVPPRPGWSECRCVGAQILLPSLVLVVDPALAEPQLNDGDHHDHDEEHPGERRRVAEPEVLEGLVEQVDDVEQPLSIPGR